MVLNCSEDHLYSMAEMKRADAMLRETFQRAAGRKVQVRLLPRRPPLRPPHAGRGIQLVRTRHLKHKQ